MLWSVDTNGRKGSSGSGVMGYNCREQCEDSASLPHFSPSFLLADSRDALCTGVHRLCAPYFFSTWPRVLRNFDGTPSLRVVVEVGPRSIDNMYTVAGKV